MAALLANVAGLLMRLKVCMFNNGEETSSRQSICSMAKQNNPVPSDFCVDTDDTAMERTVQTITLDYDNTDSVLNDPQIRFYREKVGLHVPVPDTNWTIITYPNGNDNAHFEEMNNFKLKAPLPNINNEVYNDEPVNDEIIDYPIEYGSFDEVIDTNEQNISNRNYDNFNDTNYDSEYDDDDNDDHDNDDDDDDDKIGLHLPISDDIANKYANEHKYYDEINNTKFKPTLADINDEVSCDDKIINDEIIDYSVEYNCFAEDIDTIKPDISGTDDGDDDDDNDDDSQSFNTANDEVKMSCPISENNLNTLSYEIFPKRMNNHNCFEYIDEVDQNSMTNSIRNTMFEIDNDNILLDYNNENAADGILNDLKDDIHFSFIYIEEAIALDNHEQNTNLSSSNDDTNFNFYYVDHELNTDYDEMDLDTDYFHNSYDHIKALTSTHSECDLLSLEATPLELHESLDDSEMTLDLSNADPEPVNMNMTEANEMATADGVIPSLVFHRNNGALSVLGRGTFGNVYKAYLDKELVAVKVIQIRGEITEGQIHAHVNYHENIIKVDVTYTIANMFEGIVMEFGVATVTELISSMKDSQCNADTNATIDPVYGKYLATCIMKAIAHLHRQRIAHLDIKAENILLTPSGVPKVSDFSSSVIINPGDVLHNYPVGTEGYQAPEIIIECGYGASADWFALGALLTFITLGHLPWGTSQLKQMEILETGRLSDHGLNVNYMDKDMLCLVLQLLCSRPEERMGTEMETFMNMLFSVSPQTNEAPDCPTLDFAYTHILK